VATVGSDLSSLQAPRRTAPPDCLPPRYPECSGTRAGAAASWRDGRSYPILPGLVHSQDYATAKSIGRMRLRASSYPYPYFSRKRDGQDYCRLRSGESRKEASRPDRTGPAASERASGLLVARFVDERAWSARFPTGPHLIGENK